MNNGGPSGFQSDVCVRDHNLKLYINKNPQPITDKTRDHPQ